MFHEILTSLEVFDPATRIWLVIDALGLLTVYLVGIFFLGTIFGKFFAFVASNVWKRARLFLIYRGWVPRRPTRFEAEYLYFIACESEDGIDEQEWLDYLAFIEGGRV